MSLWEDWKKKHGGVTPLDLFDLKHQRITEVEINRRYDICLECPRLIYATKTCKECGCFMAAKTRLDAASCPLGKWSALENE